MDVATPILEVFASNELGDERLTIDPYADVATLILELFDMDTDSAAHLRFFFYLLALISTLAILLFLCVKVDNL